MKSRKPRPAPPGIPTRVADWFAATARELPWRTSPRDPYRTLVSELMLQQTQVSRVVPKFIAFLERFPTIESLAAATVDDVLAMWSGLGYYRRARHLHAAALAIVERFGGRFPEDVELLRTLPGVGRYTAGALLSIGMQRPAPLVDGNVARVLLRVRGLELDAEAGLDRAWEEAERLVAEAEGAGGGPLVAALNEGLMEIGATVCAPVAPRCADCPIRDGCVAMEEGLQDDIPAPRVKPPKQTITCAVVVVADPEGRLLIEQRPETGLWAGLWQAPTFETDGRAPDPGALMELLGLTSATLDPAPPAVFTHQTTHRRVEFIVHRAHAPAEAARALARNGRTWIVTTDLHRVGLGNAQRRALTGD